MTLRFLPARLNFGLMLLLSGTIPLASAQDTACGARILLVVNGQVVSRTFTYSTEAGADSSEQFESVTAAALASSSLTQYFLRSPMSLFEPSQLERELTRQQTLQSADQVETLISTDQSDFIVMANVSVSTQPFELAQGGELYDSQAMVTLSVHRASSGGEIVIEERLEGRSRLDYPSAQEASLTAVERALVGLEPADTAPAEPTLVDRMCRAFASSTPDVQTSRASFRIEVSNLTEYRQALSLTELLEKELPDLEVANFTFDTAKAVLTVTVPVGTNIDDIAVVLLDSEDPALDVLQRQDSFLELEAF